MIRRVSSYIVLIPILCLFLRAVSAVVVSQRIALTDPKKLH